MAYPPPPWKLQGYALQTVHLVDSSRARALIPAELKIFSILPGRTLGAVYLGCYGPGSVLEYSELIIVPALVRAGSKLGFWISHIYVDNADSMAGGREIWGLPKELARFTWENGSVNRVTVRQGERQLCSLSYGRPRSLWRQRFSVPTLSVLDSDLLFFKGMIRAGLGLAGARLAVPDGSPFSSLGLGRGGFSVYYREMDFLACSPEKVS